MAVLQALGGYTSEAGWLRHAGVHLRHLFPYQPRQPAYNKRLRALVDTMSWLIGVLAADTTVAGVDLWVVDSTPVECARSKGDGPTLSTGWVGPVRLLRLPFPLLLGAASAPGGHRARAARGVGGDRGQS